MKKQLQTSLNVTDDQQLKRIWAFASGRAVDIRDSVITACSKEARVLGVQSGMRYDDAKTLLPDMRILVIGGSHV